MRRLDLRRICRLLFPADLASIGYRPSRHRNKTKIYRGGNEDGHRWRTALGPSFCVPMKGNSESPRLQPDPLYRRPVVLPHAQPRLAVWQDDDLRGASSHLTRSHRVIRVARYHLTQKCRNLTIAKTGRIKGICSVSEPRDIPGNNHHLREPLAAYRGTRASRRPSPLGRPVWSIMGVCKLREGAS